MVDVGKGIEMEMDYTGNGPEKNETFPTYFRNIALENITSISTQLQSSLPGLEENSLVFPPNGAFRISCLEDFPCTNLSFRNIRMTCVRNFFFENVASAEFSNVILGSGAVQCKFTNVGRLLIDGFQIDCFPPPLVEEQPISLWFWVALLMSLFFLLKLSNLSSTLAQVLQFLNRKGSFFFQFLRCLGWGGTEDKSR
jgi:hypothetical protein